MYAIAIPPETPSGERIDYLMRAGANLVKYWYDNDTVYMSGNKVCLTHILKVVPNPTVPPLWYEVPFRVIGPVMYDYNDLKPVEAPK